NYRMSNICAGIGRGQMEMLDQRVKQRRRNFQFYKSRLESNGVSFHEEPDDSYFSNHWLTAALFPDYNSRELVRTHLEKQNIEARPLWKPMHLQPVFEGAPYYENGTSETLFSRGLCLPSGS